MDERYTAGRQGLKTVSTGLDLGNGLVTTQCSCGLLRRASRRMTQIYDRALLPAGIKISQFGVLATVEKHAGATVTELASRMKMDRTTLTRNLRPMVTAGWVEKRPSGGRATAVHITADGKAMLKRALPLWKRTEKEIRDKLDPKKRKQLETLLTEALGDFR